VLQAATWECSPRTLIGGRNDRAIRYVEIESVEVGRTLIIESWGIQGSIRGGSVWNPWGRDCVVVRMTKGTLRIGTDDAENLAEFLKRRIGGR
jgi:hypothetical protein